MNNKCFICGIAENLKQITDNVEIYICEDCNDLLNNVREIRKNTIVIGGGHIEIDLSQKD